MHKIIKYIAFLPQSRLGAFIAGAILALGFAPFSFWPVLCISLPVLYEGLSRAPSLRAALGRGFFFGYGFSIAGCYWIAYSLLVEADKFAWLIPFTVLGLTAVMALWWVAFAYLYYKLRRQNWFWDMVNFALLWVLVELLKTYGIFAFPWNLLGYVFADTLVVAQFAHIAGIYGVSIIAIMVGLLPVIIWRQHYRAFYIVVPLLAVVAYGVIMLQSPVKFTDTVLRLVQPNIEQSQKWDRQFAQDVMQRLRALSLLPAADGRPQPDMVIWPETALPFSIIDSAGWQRVSKQFVPEHATLVTGMVRREHYSGGESLYNSMLVVKDGRLLAGYDKKQLVPFGEFVPFRGILPLQKITHGIQDFSPGVVPTTIALEGGINFGIFICYESIFPNHVDNMGNKLNLLINITNDAWFGDSPGPYQHLAMARMRAIEQGAPLARVANTGISALIDPYGRVSSKLSLNVSGVIDHPLPQARAAGFFIKMVENGKIILSIYILFTLLVNYTTYARKH